VHRPADGHLAGLAPLHPGERAAQPRGQSLSPARRVGLAAALAVATLVAYAQVRHHEYLNYDDDLYVVENPNLAEGLSPTGLRWAFSLPEDGDGLHIPVTWLSYLLDAQLWGLEPGAVLLANLGYHIAAGVLLFLALSAATGAAGRSAFAAAVFLLHPLHVESVAWASERKDVVCALFWNASLLAWVVYARRPTLLRHLAVVVGCALAMAAKPMAVTLPAVLLLLDYWPLGRLGPGGRIEAAALRRALLEKLPLAGLSAVCAWVAYRAQQADGTMRSLEMIPLATRLANAGLSYLAYLGNALWPADLRIFYAYRDEPGWAGAAAVALVLALTGLALALARRLPYLSVGWLWYVGTLVPVIGLVQVGQQAMADRYTYLPLVGIGIAAAWGGHALALRMGARAALAPLALALALAMTFATRAEVAHWRDGVALFEHALQADPGEPSLQGNLGIALLRRGEVDAGVRQLAAAFGVREQGAAAAERVAGLLAARAESELRQGRSLSALLLLRAALHVTPEVPRLHDRLGRALFLQARYDEAFEHFRRAGLGDEALAQLHARAAEECGRRGREACERGQRRQAIDAAARAARFERDRGREGRASEIEERRRDWLRAEEGGP
jgi:tetratricopeptide (TPR) repeat protein